MLSKIDNFAEKYKDYVSVFLRIGIAFVFLYFGVNEVINPDFGLTYISEWAKNLIPIDLELFVFLFGIGHIIGAALLILGFLTRETALIVVLVLLSIIINLGFNELSARDFAIMLSAIALFLNGPGKWSVDERMKH